MKKITLLLILFTSFLHSQKDKTVILPIDKTTGKITYQGVVKVDGVGSEELYLRARSWFAHSFNSANHVIQMDNLDSGIIVGKGLFNVNYKNPLGFISQGGAVHFSLDVRVKEGRFKYVLTDIKYDSSSLEQINSHGDLREKKPGGGINNMGKKGWKFMKEQTDEKSIDLINSLIKSMNSTNDQNDDW